ncbi:MAG: sigma-70 family RNA polymerase sigma factor [Acidothermales bacterium]|nr:sigma-70 family RNA polymerase sigma factor [Acidothermales bacterium]
MTIQYDEQIPERDLVGTYLDEISRTPLLDAVQEVELSKDVEAGLFAEHLLETGKCPKGVKKAELAELVGRGQAAKQRFIQANLRLVVSVARRYGGHQMPLLDLVQEGNTGLVRAVEKFDYHRGFKFSTYATWWIRQAISRAIAQTARTVRLPVHVVEELNRMGSARRALTRQLGRDPEIDELAAAMDMPVDRVEELVNWAREPLSLDAKVGDDEDTSLGDLVEEDDAASPEDVVLASVQREDLDLLIDRLDDRSATIVRARFGFSDGRQHSLSEIGRNLGLTRERIRQLEREALAKLKKYAATEGFDGRDAA